MEVLLGGPYCLTVDNLERNALCVRAFISCL